MKNLFCFLFLLSISVSAQEVVQITSGKIRGVQSSDGQINIYKGIPFAAPPLADLRWKEPQPVTPWKDVLSCTDFGPSPMQGKPAPFSMWSEEFLIPVEPIEEDCLYLNVWSSSNQKNKPVLVWIYGGGFMTGGSAVPIYNGEAMARKDIVFVSINYRVGIFGFLAHPELSKESEHNASGNYGLMDQIAALKWVKENIEAFGGDPSNVTIAGQSAGSMSVNALVASPLAKGLFKRAIAHSGANLSGGQMTLKEAEKIGQTAAIALNAPDLKTLRSLPDQELMRAQVSRGPIVDGYVLPEQILDIFQKEKQNPVDLLTGWTEDEGLMLSPVVNAQQYKQRMKSQYGETADDLLLFYPATNDDVAERSQLEFSRDVMFGVQNYAWANIQAEQANRHTYVYRFKRKVPGEGEYANYGAFHTGDVPYAYNNLEFVNRPWQAADHDLEKAMSTYWANFIKTGNPNGKELPIWPQYDLKNSNIMILDSEVKSVSLPDKKALDLVYSIIKN